MISGVLRVAAVVVTFNPDEGVFERLRVISRECDEVIVVDNGSGTETVKRLLAKGVEVVALGENRGLATALNIGLSRAIKLGFFWAVTFDQDSTPQAGMVAALWATRECFASPDGVAIVGPRLREERVVHEDHRWVVRHERCQWWFRRVPCVDRDLVGVAFVITSGALMDLRIFAKIGPMDDGLFIDYIDHDYCLRARRLGFEILVSAGAMLGHNLGTKREFTVAGRKVRPTFHSALRLRYMARNRWVLWRRYARMFPYWAAFDGVYSHYNLLRVLVFEDGRLPKLAAVVRGTWDGLLGRKGKFL